MKFSLSNYSNLRQRLITAVIGAALILAGCMYGPWTYFTVFFIVCIFSLLEFYKLAGLDGILPLKFYGAVNAMAIYTLSFLSESGWISPKWYFIIFPGLSMIFLIKLYGKEEKPFNNIAYTFLGIIYIGLPFALLNFIVFASGEYNPQVVIGIFLLLWASDVGAYFVGIPFGKTKLFERISPKKTWEGFVGGFILSILMATLVSWFFNDLNLFNWYIFAFLIVVTGTYGDLVESLFKRGIAIKDSGKVLPGHGGFLDRFDGLLIALSFIACYLKLLVY